MNHFRYLRIIVVDHDPIFPILTREFLRIIGFEYINVASQINDAVNIISREHHDVAIIEDDRAYDGLAEILRRQEHEDCLVLSCAFARNMERSCDSFAGGTDGFIGKPFTPSALRHALASALKGPAGRRLKVVNLSSARRARHKATAPPGREVRSDRDDEIDGSRPGLG